VYPYSSLENFSGELFWRTFLENFPEKMCRSEAGLETEFALAQSLGIWRSGDMGINQDQSKQDYSKDQQDQQSCTISDALQRRWNRSR
jgi:hypothetical protein